MNKKHAFLFVVLPLCINAVLIGMYFSQIKWAQNIISPTNIAGMHSDSWREFGLLEQLECVYLLAIALLFIVAVIKRDELLEKAFFLLGALIFVFLLLEEVDYGIHFYEYLTGNLVSVESRNWHNQGSDGRQNVETLKKLTDLAVVIWFLLIPLIAQKVRLGFLKRLVPSIWFIAGFILSVFISRIAHTLDDSGFAVINGVAGSLTGNISEFREVSTYYLFLLYAIQLIRTRPLFRQAD